VRTSADSNDHGSAPAPSQRRRSRIRTTYARSRRERAQPDAPVSAAMDERRDSENTVDSAIGVSEAMWAARSRTHGVVYRSATPTDGPTDRRNDTRRSRSPGIGEGQRRRRRLGSLNPHEHAPNRDPRQDKTEQCGHIARGSVYSPGAPAAQGFRGGSGRLEGSFDQTTGLLPAQHPVGATNRAPAGPGSRDRYPWGRRPAAA
jgi:hypothetical protein